MSSLIPAGCVSMNSILLTSLLSNLRKYSNIHSQPVGVRSSVGIRSSYQRQLPPVPPACKPTPPLLHSFQTCACVFTTHPACLSCLWPCAWVATTDACLPTALCYLTLYCTVTCTHHTPCTILILTLCTLSTLHLHASPNWPHTPRVSSGNTQLITHTHIHTLT